jgi:hypothetical protein
MFDVIEDVQVEANKPLPEGWNSVPLQATLVIFVGRSDWETPEDSEIRISLHSPDGNSHEKVWAVPVDLKEHSKARHFMRFQSVPFYGPGRHRFVIRLKGSGDTWSEVTEIPFIVTVKIVASDVSGDAPSATTPRKSRTKG